MYIHIYIYIYDPVEVDLQLVLVDQPVLAPQEPTQFWALTLLPALTFALLPLKPTKNKTTWSETRRTELHHVTKID